MGSGLRVVKDFTMDELIAQMVAQRREALGDADTQRRPWGLALSGGGIRSATFCLGLLKALAQRGQLLRFDLLSTVSGGGYAGGTLGRLCDEAARAGTGGAGAREAESTFADLDRTRLGAWLRGNGRYLIPGGLGDVLFAVALYLRNLLGTHIELAIAATLLGLALGGVDLLTWSLVARAVPLDDAQIPTLVAWASRVPTLWSAIVALVPLTVVAACAYWAVREGPRTRVASMAAVGALAWGAAGALAWWVGPVLQERYSAPLWIAPAAFSLATLWVAAELWCLKRALQGDPAAALRNELTLSLSRMLRCALIVALLGLVDAGAWWLAQGEHRALRFGAGGVLAVAAAALRAAVPLLSSGRREVPGLGRGALLTLANLLGQVVSLCLVTWWVSVLYAVLLLPVFTGEGLDFALGGVWWWLLLVAVGGYALVTGRNIDFLNLSSLHMFYKARIVRAYLGAANATRLGGAPKEALSPTAMPTTAVGKVADNDDVVHGSYRPHAAGGPVHLINLCVNQTMDPRQASFNRDRRGQPMTVAPEGWMRADSQKWQRIAEVPAARLTLGAWMAISGAAVSPGLGRLTRRGLAALSLFAGVRLGYWWDAGRARVIADRPRWMANPLAKTTFVLRECFGIFPGVATRHWFLSDGGHFENTGAYALLQQRARLIVLADCGADPAYRFCDLENLVRCARIDLGADIVFLKPRAGAPGAFGSLNDLASINSQACLALARVGYVDGTQGFIVLVKPNMSADLPVDLINFKAEHPVFPQEPTTDQFFSEAQWESYFRLGTAIGAHIDGVMLDGIASRALLDGFEVDDGQPGRAAPARTPRAGSTWSRIQARVAAHGVVQTSLGIGGVATLALAAWQAASSYGTQSDAERKAQDDAFKVLADRWSRLDANGRSTRRGEDGEAAAPRLAGELLRATDSFCAGAASSSFFQRYALSARIVNDANVACDRDEVRSAPACAELLARARQPGCLDMRRERAACVPHYWGRDYSGRLASQDNCLNVRSMPWQPVVAVAGPALDWLAGWTGPMRMARTAPPPTSSASPAARPAPQAAPDAAPTPAPPAVAPVPGTAASPCRGAEVYVQIFGAGDREAARAMRPPWRALGASVPPIEDVLATARNAGRAPPLGYAQPTVLYHSPAMRACAQALTAAAAPPRGVWVVQPLPAGLRASPQTIEVWLARGSE